jgi:hypothetical protein
MAVMTLLCVLGTLAGRRWAIIAFPLLLSIHIGMFVPVLAQDAQVAGVVILWNLLLIGDYLFSLSVRNPRARRRADDDTATWLARYGAAVRHLLLVAVLGAMAVGGFALTESTAARYVCLALDIAVIVAAAPFVIKVLRQHRRYLIALGLLLAVGVPQALDSFPALLAMFGIFQGGVLAADARAQPGLRRPAPELLQPPRAADPHDLRRHRRGRRAAAVVPGGLGRALRRALHRRGVHGDERDLRHRPDRRRHAGRVLELRPERDPAADPARRPRDHGPVDLRHRAARRPPGAARRAGARGDARPGQPGLRLRADPLHRRLDPADRGRRRRCCWP